MIKIVEAHPDLYIIHHYRKGTIILSHSSFESQHWYVKSELLKVSFFAEDLNRDIILDFWWDNMFMSLDFLRSMSESMEIVMVRNSILYSMPEKYFNTLKQEHPEIEDFHKNCARRMMKLLLDKSVFLHYNGSTAQYNAMAKEYPFLPDLKISDAAALVGFSRKTIQTIRSKGKNSSKLNGTQSENE